MSGFTIISWILVIAAIIFAASHPKKTKEAIDYLGGFGITVAAFLIILIFVVPWLVSRSEPALRANYGDVFSGDNSGPSADILDFFRPNASSGAEPAYQDGLAFPTAGPAPENYIDPFATAVPPIEGGAGGGMQYTVQPGDTLSIIANRFNTTVATLQQLNGITDPNSLFPGQIILVVTTGAAVPEAALSQSEPGPTATPRAQATPPPMPTPTQTPINLAIYYQALEALRLRGSLPCPPELQRLAEGAGDSSQMANMNSRGCALVMANRVLSLNPGDQTAVRIQNEVNTATYRLEGIKNLGSRTPANSLGLRGFNYAAGFDDEVDALLVGLELKITSTDVPWNGSSWLSNAELEIIGDDNGWLLGERFNMALGHTTRHGAKQPGDVFRVN